MESKFDETKSSLGKLMAELPRALVSTLRTRFLNGMALLNSPA
jgi:hypothetical protein